MVRELEAKGSRFVCCPLGLSLSNHQIVIMRFEGVPNDILRFLSHICTGLRYWTRNTCTTN